MRNFSNALHSLGVEKYAIYGNSTNESEFNKCFKKIVGQEEGGTAILSDDPSEFGVTWEQLSNQLEVEEQKYNALQYQRDRQYPSIGDQLDMQYHDEIDGTTTWKDAIAKVKADNPKE